MPAGRVTEFDRHRGLGVVTDAAGHEWPFHCIEIADGTRRIDVGAHVTFELLGKLGRFEAARIIAD